MTIVTEIVEKMRKYQGVTGKRAKKVKLGVEEYNRLREFAKKECMYDIDQNSVNRIYQMEIVKSDRQSELSLM